LDGGVSIPRRSTMPAGSPSWSGGFASSFHDPWCRKRARRKMLPVRSAYMRNAACRNRSFLANCFAKRVRFRQTRTTRKYAEPA
jgi:hypothetical protein